jgi:type 1 glutamine amidotransferase
VAGLGAAGVDVVVDPDAAQVTEQGLARFDSVVMLSTTGDWLDDGQQAALEKWARAGGGIAGIHAATDAEPAWPFLEELFGTRFASHPAVQSATVVIEDATHPASARLPARWTVTDEWYAFTSNPRDRVHVLATVDETTYAGGVMDPTIPSSGHGSRRRSRSDVVHGDGAPGRPVGRPGLRCARCSGRGVDRRWLAAATRCRLPHERGHGERRRPPRATGRGVRAY